MRVRKKKWAAGELQNNPLILRDTAEFKQNLKACFLGPALPLHLEIGCGKGRFITEISKLCPDINYIAIEKDPTIIAAAARLAREKEAENIKFIECDANELASYFKPFDVSRLYINFCDPWPTKKKRARRRLTHDIYLEIYDGLKIPEIFFKTDNRILFEFSLESFCRCGWQLKNISLDLHNSGHEDNVMTEYEEKFSAHGPIYRLEAVKNCA